MGLEFKTLKDWEKWQSSRRRLHAFKDRFSGSRTDEPPIELWVRGRNPELLVAVDSNSPTTCESLLAPVAAVPDLPVVVAKPADVDLELPGGDWRQRPAVDLTVRRMASVGDHLRVGAWARDLSAVHGWEQLFVQHGLLTPFAPPPPPGATVLAWSEEDAGYLLDGREDLQAQVVGSPMMWRAAHQPQIDASEYGRPVFLGQLHGAELPRRKMARSVSAFWRVTQATYRPHPREEDKLSRLQHALWRRQGMEIDRSGSLRDINRPIVSAFSTGVLEAAARGVPSWVFHLDPPEWLEEFWDRYGMARWGEAPTQFTPQIDDPVSRIAARFAGEE